jgi:hypothetical protein
MWAPHPSVAPFEFARAGIVTVTNEFGIRTADFLKGYGDNIVPAQATVEGITDALAVAVSRVGEAEVRVAGANFDWPTKWDDVFDMAFIDRFTELVGNPPLDPVPMHRPAHMVGQPQPEPHLRAGACGSRDRANGVP